MLIHEITTDDPQYTADFCYGDIDLTTDEIVDEAYGPVNFPKLGNCKIHVYGNEGKIPHFHIISNDNKFECCVCIYLPKYFAHGSKQGKLTRKQKIILDKFLRLPDPSAAKMGIDMSIWQSISLNWMNVNPDSVYPKNQIIQPDYTLMGDDTINYNK
jgi:hypothetical protein